MREKGSATVLLLIILIIIAGASVFLSYKGYLRLNLTNTGSQQPAQNPTSQNPFDQISTQNQNSGYTNPFASPSPAYQNPFDNLQ